MLTWIQCPMCGAEFISPAEWRHNTRFHAWQVVFDPPILLEYRHHDCGTTMANDATEEMMVSTHMMVGYDAREAAIAVGYGPDAESAIEHYRESETVRQQVTKRPIVRTVLYTKTDTGWVEVEHGTP